MITRKILISSLLFIAVSCSVVPLTGRRQFTAIPASQMLSLSNDSYRQVLKENKKSTNQKYVKMVNDVGIRISAAVEEYMRQNGLAERIKEFNWEFNVIISDQMNAWCMPGGKIAFYEGIMPVCIDDNGVAVVMAHEVAHAVARHGNERMSQQLAIQMGGIALSQALKEKKEATQNLAMAAFGVGSQVGILLPYSRTHEKEADELGLYFMAMAGYDPHGAVDFWKRMNAVGGARPPEFLSTHPNPESRIKQLEQLIPKAMKYYKKK